MRSTHAVLSIPLAAAALLAGGTSLAAPASYGAAASTCLGANATITGSSGQTEIRGTAGDDVIVTNGSARVFAMGGDDRVCVTGPLPVEQSVVFVDAGAGDDSVDASGAAGATETRLDAGQDTFVGGPFTDTVAAQDDGEHDVVSTGAGADAVAAYDGPNGQPSAAGADEVHLGAGDDRLDLGLVYSQVGDLPAAALNPITGDDGLDIVTFHAIGPDDSTGHQTPVTSVAVDDVAGTVAFDGVVGLQQTGFEAFPDLDRNLAQRVAFTGSDAAEGIDLGLAYSGTRFDLDLAGGDDKVNLMLRPNQPVSIDGGSGRDAITVYGHPRYPAGEVAIDLDADHGTIGVVRGTSTTANVTGLEDATAYGFTRAHLIGNDSANKLKTIGGCQVTEQGRAGDDLLVMVHPSSSCGVALTAQGGMGDDELRGTERPDRLYGNQGTDLADGKGGKDVCTAEREISC